MREEGVGWGEAGRVGRERGGGGADVLEGLESAAGCREPYLV